MEELILKRYYDLCAISAEFRAFSKEMEKYTAEEINAMYGLENNAKACLDLLRKPYIPQNDV